MVAEGSPAGRQIWIDGLRLFAGISMIGLHVTADAHGQPYPDSTQSERVVPMLLRAVLYTARTELFLIISLLLLLMALARRPRPYTTVVGVQIRRLLVPFLFWTVFYAAYSLLKAEAFGYGQWARDRLADPAAWTRFLLLGDVKYHMHFLPTLFALVLFFPLFRAAEKHPLLGLSILPCLWAKQVLDGQIHMHLWQADTLSYALRAAKIGTYLGYGMVAGAALGIWRRTDSGSRQRWLWPVAAAAAALFALKLPAMVQVIVTGQWHFDDPMAFWADFLTPVALLALCLCLSDRRWPPVLSQMSKYAFGLYLCHPIFLDLIEIALRGRDLSPLQMITLEFAWTLPTTALFVWVLSRHRLTAWTVGLGPLPGAGAVPRHQQA